MSTRPVRVQGFVVEPLDDGFVILDPESNQAHSLSASAAHVWSAADGSRSFSEIARDAGITHAEARSTLDQLAERGLLVGAPGVSRRSVLKRAVAVGAAATAAAPLIETIVIPTATVGPEPQQVA